MKLKSFLRIFAGLAVLLTLLPFIAIDYWWIRIFDFPHVQLTLLTLVALLTYFIRFDVKHRNDYIIVAVLLGCFIFQLLKIFPYTPVAGYEMLENTRQDEATTFSLYTANVLQDNDKPDKVLAAIQSYDADLLLFMETDRKWQASIAPAVRNSHPYKVEVPLDNTYGMLLYSRLPLVEPRVKYIVDDSIPSIHTRFTLPSGDQVQLYAIHPTPPMPQHNPSSTDRDAEMMKIALLSMDAELPVLVLGDFNDVAWSESTRNFQQVSGLLDPRKGRGFFNTFNAKKFFMRWPLDHIFASEHFRLVSMERGEDIDSDHFPVSAVLSYEPEGAPAQILPPAPADEIEKARKQIQAEKEAEQKD